MADQAQELTQIANIEPDKGAAQIQTVFFNPVVWEQIKGMSKVFWESKAIPKGIENLPQLIMIVQAGYEMGMKPVEAMKSLYIVNGMINIWGQALIRRLTEHGYIIEYTNETDDSVTARVTKGNEVYEETFSFKQAEQSGYTTSYGKPKVGWNAGINRRRKMRYGVISLIAHTNIPHVFGSANEIVEVMEDAPDPTRPILPKPQKEAETTEQPQPSKSAVDLKKELEQK